MTARDPSDAALVAVVRSPRATMREQHAAYAALVTRWESRVFGLAFRRLHDADAAADVAQEAFITAWLRLKQLRDPAAFGGWLRRITTSLISRRLGKQRELASTGEAHRIAFPEVPRDDYRTMVAAAIATLSEGDRQATVLFYFLGHSLRDVARLLQLRPGTVAKRLHSARLRIRRVLPSFVRHDFIRVKPTRSLRDRVKLGLFDEYVGEYRFDRRPSQAVRIAREGDSLVSYAGGQRNVLATLTDDTMVTSHYDGEGRFARDRQGRITHFTYYEFGKRLGKATRVADA